MMRAIDVLDPETGEPDHDLRDSMVMSAFYKGLLLLGCGENAIRFCPPLCVSSMQIETALNILEEVVAESGATKVAV